VADNAGDGIADQGKGPSLIENCCVAGNKGAAMNLESDTTYRDCFVQPGGQIRGGHDLKATSSPVGQ
jgi:hypothetical protein